MLLRAYSIYDNKALIYHAPFFFGHDAQATRAMTDLVSDPNTQLGRHPGDFVLYWIGTYNDQTGQLHPMEPRVHICDAIALVPRDQGNLFPIAAQ